jgi:transposase
MGASCPPAEGGIRRELQRLELVLQMIADIEAERDAIVKETAPQHSNADKIKALAELSSIGPEFATRLVGEETKIGLCTDPADRPRAEAAIRDMYRQGGLEPPSRIVWCGSLLSQGLTRAIVIDRKAATILCRS